MLRKRILTALWGIPLVIAAVWFDQPIPWFTVLAAIWGLLAAYEFYRLIAAYSVIPFIYFGLLWTLLFILSGDSGLRDIIEPHFDVNLITPLLLTSGVLLSLLWLLRQAKKENAFTGWVWTMAGILYVGWLMSYLVALRGLDDGRNWIFFALFTNFGSDTAAFFIGRSLGKQRLAPSISPGKTWEGTIGGIFGAIIISLIFTLPTPLELSLNYWQAVLLGILISIFGQLGDLVESLFKRNIGVKDSGNLLPGHGGVLDRMDSIVFVGVVVYYYTVFTTP